MAFEVNWVVQSVLIKRYVECRRQGIIYSLDTAAVALQKEWGRIERLGRCLMLWWILTAKGVPNHACNLLKFKSEIYLLHWAWTREDLGLYIARASVTRSVDKHLSSPPLRFLKETRWGPRCTKQDLLQTIPYKKQKCYWKILCKVLFTHPYWYLRRRKWNAFILIIVPREQEEPGWYQLDLR